jgi:quercetin dioxygenase-like cupin family protein
MPRHAALARGPGESCGNRQADGEELHPHVSYFTSSRITRIFSGRGGNNVASEARRRLRRSNRQIRPSRLLSRIAVLNAQRKSIFAATWARLSNYGARFTEEVMVKSMKLALACLGAVALLGVASFSREKKSEAPGHGIIRSADLKWTPIMKGCELAPVNGDPTAEGTEFVLRLKCAAGTKIPAHWHPTDENVTVLQGTFQVGMGEKFDASKLESMTLEKFASVPKEMSHFALSKTATVVQVNGIGPFKVNWVTPSEVIPPDTKPAK